MYILDDDSEELESASDCFCIETRLGFGLGLISTGKFASSLGIEINGRSMFQ
jgi:hypothetical protein